MQRWRILPPPGRSSSPGPGGRPLSPREDSHTFGIAFHSRYFCPYGIIDQGYASVAKRLWRGQQPDHQWPQQGGRQILRVFLSYDAISAAPSYNDPGNVLMGRPPASRRGDRGVVLLQDQLPSTALLPLQRTSPEAGF